MDRNEATKNWRAWTSLSYLKDAPSLNIYRTSSLHSIKDVLWGCSTKYFFTVVEIIFWNSTFCIHSLGIVGGTQGNITHFYPLMLFKGWPDHRLPPFWPDPLGWRRQVLRYPPAPLRHVPSIFRADLEFCTPLGRIDGSNWLGSTAGRCRADWSEREMPIFADTIWGPIHAQRIPKQQAATSCYLQHQPLEVAGGSGRGFIREEVA